MAEGEGLVYVVPGNVTLGLIAHFVLGVWHDPCVAVHHPVEPWVG